MFKTFVQLSGNVKSSRWQSISKNIIVRMNNLHIKATFLSMLQSKGPPMGGGVRILYPARKLKQILYPAEFFGSIPYPPRCLLFTIFVLYISPIVRVLTKK